MRFIPTRTHGMIDYIVGVALVLAPWLFGFAQGGAETWTPVLIGLGTILYSLFTNYELGVVRRIPMSTHLGLDIAGGAVLAISPWLFGYAAIVWVPHVLVGLVEIVAGLTTRTVPGGGARVSGPAGAGHR